MNKRQKGFTLIELLIVVAIILIIAAIAIPNLLRSQMAAHEASAVGSIRTINTAQVTYNSTYEDGYATSLLLLGGPTTVAATCNAAELIDPILSAAATSQKSGYSFTVSSTGTPVTVAPTGCANPGDGAGFGVIGVPITVGTSGQRSFCSDGSGVIRYDPTGAPAAPANDQCPSGLGALQ